MTLRDISNFFNKLSMIEHNYSIKEIQFIVSELEKNDTPQLNDKNLWTNILIDHYYDNYGKPMMFNTQDGMDISSLSYYLTLIKEALNNEMKKEKK